MKTTKWAVVGVILPCLAVAASCDTEQLELPGTVSCEASCHGGDSAPTSGNHTAHVAAAGYGCAKCHDGYDSQLTHNNGFDETSGLIAFDSWNPSGTYAEGTGRCSSLYCHGPSAVDWGGSAPLCGDCHGDTMPPTSGSHAVHTGNDFSDPSAPKYSFACSECHNGAGDGTALHVNLTVDVILDPLASSLVTGYGTNGGNVPTWNAGPKTCENVYCHSNGVTLEKGGTYDSAHIDGAPDGALSYNTPVWGETVSCGDCHAGAPLDAIASSDDYPATGEHRNNFHVGTGVGGYTYVQCFWCHSTGSLDALQGTYGSAEHVDGALKFHPYSTGVAPGTIWSTSGRSYQDSHCGGTSGSCWY